LKFDEFWSLTPAELNSLSVAYGKKRDSEFQLLRASAYWSESLSRTKRLPGYENWINPPKESRALSGEEAETRRIEHEENISLIEELISNSEQGSRKEASSDG
jgi:hypothetical protein